MDIKQKFGNNLKKLRLDKGLSQEKLALISDIDRTYLPSIEKGERNVSIVIAEKLAKALNVPISELFKD
jgi:transcriptional regulator with XRE-family HTH domain